MPTPLKPPPFPQIQKLHGVPRELHDALQSISSATEAARKNEMNDGRVVEVELDPSSGALLKFSHKLGRKPRGYQIVAALGPGDATFRSRTKRDDGTGGDTETHTSRQFAAHVSGTTSAKFKVRVW